MQPTATSGAAPPSARAAEPKAEPHVTLGSRILWYSVGALLFLPPLLAPPWLIFEEWQWRQGASVVEAQVLSTTGIERGSSSTRGRHAWFQRTAQVRFTDAAGRVRVATAERPFHASFETQAGARVAVLHRADHPALVRPLEPAWRWSARVLLLFGFLAPPLAVYVARRVVLRRRTRLSATQATVTTGRSR